jgi:hypothetical protein
MNLQEILWFIPLASFALAVLLMRKAGPSLSSAGDSSVKDVRLAEERARRILAGGREALKLDLGLADPAPTPAQLVVERPTARIVKRSALACGVIDRGPVPQSFLSRGAASSVPGRYVAGMRGGIVRPRRLVFLHPTR